MKTTGSCSMFYIHVGKCLVCFSVRYLGLFGFLSFREESATLKASLRKVLWWSWKIYSHNKMYYFTFVVVFSLNTQIFNLMYFYCPFLKSNGKRFEWKSQNVIVGCTSTFHHSKKLIDILKKKWCQLVQLNWI